MLLTVLHSVWGVTCLPAALTSLLKHPCCRLITGWRSRKSICLRIRAHPPSRSIPQAPLSCFISSGNPVPGDREVISPQVDSGRLSP